MEQTRNAVSLLPSLIVRLGVTSHCPRTIDLIVARKGASTTIEKVMLANNEVLAHAPVKQLLIMGGYGSDLFFLQL